MKTPIHGLLAILQAIGLAACSGGGGSTATGSGAASATVPEAPLSVVTTAGNSSALIAFSAPASNGGLGISSYTASCSASGSASSASAASSPITVSALINGLSYACTVSATNAAGTGSASAPVNVTPSATATRFSTDRIACTLSVNAFNNSPSVMATSTSSWSCSSSARSLSGNGIPDHAVGTFPNADNPNAVTTQTVAAAMTLFPALSNAGSTPATVVGYAFNGIKFDPGTAGTCTVSGNATSCSLIGGGGPWRIEALGQGSFKFGTDSSNAHVQPNGAYHYHGMPEAYLTKLGKGAAMTLVGFAMDGFPVYARYGYSSANDAASAIKVITSSYILKAAPDAGRPATGSFPMGAFSQDYQYIAGAGDLDDCNGRNGVTPEFPNGIYHYFITDTYPFIQRCSKG
jgi:hypothetical protein